MQKNDLASGNILLSGTSGMLGKAIGVSLTKRNAHILKLVRHNPKTPEELCWNPTPGGNIQETERLEGAVAAIHLSGANVSSHRWTDAYKQEMTESRVSSTRVLSESLARLKNPPAVLITASATGFYGDRGDEILDESAPKGKGFFPDLCAEWEAATRAAEEAGIRVVHLRFGVVIAREGGMLARLVPLFRFGLGGPLGNGSQWISWVSEADLVSTVLFALDNPAFSGIFNTVSPQPVTNAEFTRELANLLHRPAFLAAPMFALRLAFGQMADEALLASTRAVPKRLLAAGFTFQYPSMQEALRAALRKE